jgi:hypothetical protein
MGGMRNVLTREREEAERMMRRVETELARRVEPGENVGGVEVRLRSVKSMMRKTKQGKGGKLVDRKSLSRDGKR